MLKIRVLVVDDSMFMRKLLSDLINKDPILQVVGIAKNGLEAIDLTKKLKPDVITMDIEMPEMDGISALGEIMKHFPTPTLMVSSLTDKGAYETIRALQLGAVDFIQKPSGAISVDMFRVREELVAKIKTAAKAPISTFNQPIRHINEKIKKETRSIVPKTTFDQIFAIGTSTGGPKALETVITALPADFLDPILVVQHMPPKFTHFLAKRLNDISNVKVTEAENNEIIQGGTVYIAPGDFHMEVRQTINGYRVALNKQPHRNGHRPSVDVLYDSVAKLKKLKRHYIIMTGMGNDGAQGMLRGKQEGAASTIAESEATCVVYGMPKSAIQLGCVDHVVPLHRISSKMVELSKRQNKRQ